MASCCAPSAPPHTHAGSLFHGVEGIKVETRKEIAANHELVQAYLTARADDDEKGLEVAIANLKNIKVDEKYSVPSDYPYQQIILSLTNQYFHATILSLSSSPTAMKELSERLKEVPVFGDMSKKQFTGEEIKGEEELSNQKLESLMRCFAMLLIDLKGDLKGVDVYAIIDLFRELASFGSGLWEINDE